MSGLSISNCDVHRGLDDNDMPLDSNSVPNPPSSISVFIIAFIAISLLKQPKLGKNELLIPKFG